MTLEEIQQRSYVPYSGQPEYLIVKGESGKYYPGIRIENISFPLTISATLCGIVNCLSEGDQPDVLYVTGSQLSQPKLNYWIKELKLKTKKLSEYTGEVSTPWHPATDITNQLKELLPYAITPHSDFPVAALLETDHGLISGVNIEFSTWESGLCAERTAIAKALTYGVDRSEIKAMHLHTKHGDYSSPCGACRQVIIEHMPQIPIFLYHPDGSVSKHFSSDLLPYSFTSDFLKRNS